MLQCGSPVEGWGAQPACCQCRCAGTGWVWCVSEGVADGSGAAVVSTSGSVSTSNCVTTPRLGVLLVGASAWWLSHFGWLREFTHPHHPARLLFHAYVLKVSLHCVVGVSEDGSAPYWLWRPLLAQASTTSHAHLSVHILMSLQLLEGSMPACTYFWCRGQVRSGQVRSGSTGVHSTVFGWQHQC